MNYEIELVTIPFAQLNYYLCNVLKHTTSMSITFLNRFTGELLYPTNYICTRAQVRAFAEEARKIEVPYIGLCCGNASNLLREVAEAYGQTPPAFRYMS